MNKSIIAACSAALLAGAAVAQDMPEEPDKVDVEVKADDKIAPSPALVEDKADNEVEMAVPAAAPSVPAMQGDQIERAAPEPVNTIMTTTTADGRTSTVRYMTDEEWAALQNGERFTTTSTASSGSTASVTITPTTPIRVDVRAAFAAMDSDGNASVSRAEWAAWQGRPVSYTPLFDAHDANDDGALSVPEYAASLAE